jgi:hypothetical protein
MMLSAKRICWLLVVGLMTFLLSGCKPIQPPPGTADAAPTPTPIAEAPPATSATATATSEVAQPVTRTLTFDGVEYTLAWVDTSGNTTTNEYVPIGESLTEWSTLIGVRHFHKETKLEVVIPAYLETVRSVLATEPEVLPRDGVELTEEATLVLFFVAPDQSYFEYDLHRFVASPDGVIAYQFALRFPFSTNPDASAIFARQPERAKLLNELTLPAYDSQ